MTVESIKEAIIRLSDEERDSLASWIIEQEYDHWDKEMVKDFSSDDRAGRLAEELGREIEAGTYSALEGGLKDRRKRF